jgi:hypothetical protein
MRSPILIIAALVAALASTGCPGGEGEPDGGAIADCGVAVALEVLTPDHEFVSAGPDDVPAELILGFQGFRYVYVRGRVASPPPTAAAIVITQLDGDAPRSQSPGRVELTPDGSGAQLTQPLPVYFNDDPVPDLVDRGCALTLVITEPSGTCEASAAGHAVLAYDPDCYEDPDGVRVCPDAGVSDAPDGGP